MKIPAFSLKNHIPEVTLADSPMLHVQTPDATRADSRGYKT